MTTVFNGNVIPSDMRYASSGTQYRGPIGPWTYTSCFNPQLSSDKSLDIVSAPERPGEYAMLITAHQNYRCAEAAGGDNHVLVWWYGNQNSGDSNGGVYYTGFSIRLTGLQSQWFGRSNIWMQLGSSQGSLDAGSSACPPPPGRTLSTKEVKVGYFYSGPGGDSNKFYVQRANKCGVDAIVEDFMSSSTMLVNVWHDFIIYQKWSKTNNGFIHIYHKTSSQSTYSLVYSKTGIITKYPSTNGVIEHSFGIYQGYGMNTVSAYFADYKVGTKWEDVARNTSPPCPTSICDFTITQ